MKKKHYALIFTGIVLLMVIAFTLKCFFSEQTTKLGFSCGAYFLSIFALFAYKNALKPSDSFVIDHTKRHYERKGELPKYQNLCKILFIIMISVGSLFLISGMGDVLFFHLRKAFL